MNNLLDPIFKLTADKLIYNTDLAKCNEYTIQEARKILFEIMSKEPSTDVCKIVIPIACRILESSKLWTISFNTDHLIEFCKERSKTPGYVDTIESRELRTTTGVDTIANNLTKLANEYIEKYIDYTTTG